MGLFDLFTPKKTEKATTKQTYTPDPDAVLWDKMMKDKRFQSLQQAYYQACNEIESDSSVLYNLGIISGPKMDELEQKCLHAISSLELLIPLWEKYNQPLPAMCGPARRLAIIREKQERYADAAAICGKALKLGMPDDGTKGGMRGRLAKMIRKGNLEITPEMESFLEIRQIT